jgi:hypothetical protein
MARRADLYSTVEASVVDDLTPILAEHIRLFTCPLFLDADHWRKVCCGLPRIAHLVAGRCGFKLNSDGTYFERPANLPLGKEERGVDIYPIRRRIEAVIHSLDPAGVLWTMKAAQ